MPRWYLNNAALMRPLFVAFFLLGTIGSLQAQNELEVRWQVLYQLQGATLRPLLRLEMNRSDLRYQQQGPHCTTRLRGELRLKDENGKAVYSSRLTYQEQLAEAACAGEPSGWWVVEKWLPPIKGDFHLSLLLTPPGQAVQFIGQTRGKVPEPPALSGLQLSGLTWYTDARGTQINPDEKIASQQNLLQCGFTLRSKRPVGLRYRVTMYRATPGQNSAWVQQFQSVNQLSGVLNLPAGRSQKLVPLDLEGFESGNYRVELYLLQGDKVIAKRSRRFYREWEQLDSLYSALPQSLEPMRLITKPHWVDSVQALGKTADQQEALLAFWFSPASPDPEAPLQAMQSFYKRVAAARQTFGNDLLATPEGRLSPAGYWVLYGQPQYHIIRPEGKARYLHYLHYPDLVAPLVFRETAEGYQPIALF